jgi:sulfite reductase alpha subunit-like flavoprotein
LFLLGNTTNTRSTTTTTIQQPSAYSTVAASSLSLLSRPQFDLPYKVIIITNGHQQQQPQEQDEEWQVERFASSYQSFFERLAPFNAYAYHHQHHVVEDRNSIQKLATTTHDVIDDDDDDTNMKKSCPLLLAHVVENRRITAPDWEQQDTRHVRLVLPENIARTSTNTSTKAATAAAATTAALLPYQAGDVVSIIPSNTVSIVERFLAVMPANVQELADVDLEIQNPNSNRSSSTATTYLGIYGYDGWPKHCTLRGWLTYCADIHALPDREDLYALSHYCSPTHDMSREQGKKLQSLSEASGAALYNDYILREKRSWADVLYDFDALRAPGSLLTIPALLALLSPIRPREFSIASSPTLEYQQQLLVKRQQQQQRQQSQQKDETKVAPNHHDKQQSHRGFGIDLCVAVVRGTTARGRKYHGLCSHYISQLQTANDAQRQHQQQSSVVRMWIRPGSFIRLPLQTKMDDGEGTQRFVQPVLYIGAGTGIAPIRGLIHERQAQLDQTGNSSCSNTAPVVEPTAADNQHLAHTGDEDDYWKADDILLFGCRQEKSDYYYQSEWKTLQNHGRLLVLTAFSQDQWHKIYVQQVLRKTDPTGQKLVTHLLKKAGCIYIAGGPKMASAVKEEIVELLTQQMGGAGNGKQAQQLLARLQRAGRFSVEAWS